MLNQIKSFFSRLRPMAGTLGFALALVPGIYCPCLASVTNAFYNANFELQTGNGEFQTVLGWFESSTAADYNDWVKAGTADSGQFPAGQSNVVNFSNQGGYIYQNISTFAGEPAVDIS